MLESNGSDNKKSTEDPKNTPMLVYLRKLGEKKLAESKAVAAARAKAKQEAKGAKKSQTQQSKVVFLGISIRSWS